MIDAGINEGDIIICKRCDTAENGDIVEALGEKEEATLSASARGVPRSRWKPLTPATRRASSAPTRSTSRAAWSA